MNKLKFSKLNKNIIYILLACAVAFAALQTFMVLKYYEPDVFLYAHGTALPMVFNVLLSVFVIAVLLFCSLSSCDGFSEKLAKTSAPTRIFGLFASAAILANGIVNLINYNQRTAELIYMSQKQDKFIFWSSILSFGAFIYLLIFCFIPDSAPKVKAILGCITIVWHILYLLAVYFDMTNPLNNPIRLMNEFALVGMMMYLTVEIRFLTGIPKKGFYIGTSVVAFTLLLCSSVSNLAYVISGKNLLDVSLIIFIYQFFSAGYVLTRLLSQLKVK